MKGVGFDFSLSHYINVFFFRQNYSLCLPDLNIMPQQLLLFVIIIMRRRRRRIPFFLIFYFFYTSTLKN